MLIMYKHYKPNNNLYATTSLHSSRIPTTIKCSNHPWPLMRAEWWMKISHSSLWRDSEASYIGFNLMDLDMPFTLDCGSPVGPVSLMELYSCWSCTKDPRVPSLWAPYRQPCPAFGKQSEHHPHLQWSPRSCPHMTPEGGLHNVRLGELEVIVTMQEFKSR